MTDRPENAKESESTELAEHIQSEPAADQSEPAAAEQSEPAAGQGDKPVLWPVVGIGASAGGLEALEMLFRHMPPVPGGAFVVVQHLDPHHPSIMQELLSKVTSMPVEQAGNGKAVEPNHVYVILPNATLTIRKGVLHTIIP